METWQQPRPPSITRFTVIFEKPGIYNYVRTVHPWKIGYMEVK
jgi:hypothetical protein